MIQIDGNVNRNVVPSTSFTTVVWSKNYVTIVAEAEDENNHDVIATITSTDWV